MPEKALLTTKELAARWGVSLQLLELYRKKGKGPPFLKFNKMYRYNLHDIRVYECQNTHLAPIVVGPTVPEDVPLMSLGALQDRWRMSKDEMTIWARRNTSVPFTVRKNMFTYIDEEGYSAPHIFASEAEMYVPCQSGPISFWEDSKYLIPEELMKRWDMPEYTLTKWRQSRRGAGYIKLLKSHLVYPLDAVYQFEENSCITAQNTID